MKTKIFYLKPDNSIQVETVTPILWHNYIAGRYIPSPGLFVLIELFYWSN